MFFCKKLPVDYADTLRVKHFVEIAVCHYISEVNAFLRFTPKFKMAAKSVGQTIFGKKLAVDSADTLGVKKFVKITVSRSVSEVNMFLRFTQKFKMAAKRGRKAVFWQNVASRLCRYPAGQKFRQNRSISLRFRDKHVFAFYTEIQDGRQKWRENDFWQKVASRLYRYPVSQKFRQNHSISLCFRDKRFFAFYAEIQDGRQKWRENNFDDLAPFPR